MSVGYLAFEKLFCQHDGGHCIRPTGVEGQMRDGFDQFFLSDPILHRLPELSKIPFPKEEPVQ